MTDTNEKKVKTSSYYLTTAVPLFYDRPIVPNKVYDLLDSSFLEGLHIVWHFIAFRVLESDSNVRFKLGLSQGEFINMYSPTPGDAKEAHISRDRIARNIAKNQDRVLHRSSCTVKTKVTKYGVGVSDPVVGWYNSVAHAPIKVSAIAPMLLGDEERYCSSSYDSSWQRPVCFDEFDEPYDYRSFRDHFTWLNNDSVSMADVPYFLHYSYMDYVNNPPLNQHTKLDLPTMREVYEGPRARYFKWHAEPILGQEHHVNASSCGRYLTGDDSLKGYRMACDWSRVSQPEDLDYRSLVTMSKLTKNIPNLI